MEVMLKRIFTKNGKHEFAASETGTDAEAPTTPAPNADSEGDVSWKTIGFVGGLCLLSNNITGPGMVQLPGMFQQSGWLFPVLFFLWMSFMSGYISLYLAKAMRIIPGNKNLTTRLEFEDLAHGYLPRWLHIIGMIVLIFNFQATNISSIIISAQTMDNTLVAIFGKTCGLVMIPFSHGGFHCVDGTASEDSPFGNEDYVLSIGYLIVMVMTLPLGVFNLDDNIWVQKASFFTLSAIMTIWWIQFIFFSPIKLDRVPMFGSSVPSAITTIVFNYGFVITLPSWLNEKKDNVSITKTVWASISVATTYFILLGFLGGIALDLPNGEDITSALTTKSALNPHIIISSKIASYIFPFAALLTSIPVFSIIIRYNLLQHKWINKFSANFFAVVFPWVLALVFYVGNFLTTLINWSSALLFVGLNFLLPLIIYLNVDKTPDSVNLIVSPAIGSESLLENDHLSISINASDADKDSFTPSTAPRVMPHFLRIRDKLAAKWMFGISLLLALLAIALQIQNQIQNS